MIDIEDAEHAARHGRIEELRRSYIAITDPEKDKIIIPTIRIYGHLDAFYMSLVRNGDVEILQKLMRIDHLLTPHAISTIFDAALAMYAATDPADEEKCSIYKNFMENMMSKKKTMDKLHQTCKSKYASIVLKQEERVLHSFTGDQQAAFDRETECWMHTSF